MADHTPGAGGSNQPPTGPTAPPPANQHGRPSQSSSSSYILASHNQYSNAGSHQHVHTGPVVNLPPQAHAAIHPSLLNLPGQPATTARNRYVPIVEEFLYYTEHFSDDDKGYTIVAGRIYHLEWTHVLRSFVNLTINLTDVERGWHFLPGDGPRYMIFHTPVWGLLNLPGPSTRDAQRRNREVADVEMMDEE